MMGDNEEQGFGRFNKVVYEDKPKANKKTKKKPVKDAQPKKPSSNISSQNNMKNNNARKSDFFGGNQFNNANNQNIPPQNNNKSNYNGPKLNNVDFNNVVNYDGVAKVPKQKEFEKAKDDKPIAGDIDNDNYTVDYNSFLNNPLRDKDEEQSEETSFGELMTTVNEEIDTKTKNKKEEEPVVEEKEVEEEEPTEEEQEESILPPLNEESEDIENTQENNVLILNTDDYKGNKKEQKEDNDEQEDVILPPIVEESNEKEKIEEEITSVPFEVNTDGTIKFNEEEQEEISYESDNKVIPSQAYNADEDYEEEEYVPFSMNNEMPIDNNYEDEYIIDEKYNNGVVIVVQEKKKKPWLIWLIIFLLLLLIGLGIYLYLNFWAKPSLNEVDLTDVSIIYVGEDEDILARAKGIGNLSKTIFTFTLSNNELVSLKNTDDITGKQAGNTLIPKDTGKFALYLRAKFKNKVIDLERQIVICKRLSKDSISTEKIILNVGDINQILIDLGDPLCSQNVKFEDFNNKIIDVKDDGTITGKGPGETEITVIIGDDKVTIPVEVVGDDKPNVPLKGIGFIDKSVTINVGEKRKLNVVFTPSNATNKNLTWSSADKSIVTVDNNGNITGVKKGTTTVTATSVDGNYKATITVNVVETTTITEKIAPTRITTYVNGIKKKYAKAGDTVTLVVDFSEEISVKPQIEIAGIVAQVPNGTTSFSASVVLSSSVRDGEIPVKISNYKAKSGKIGTTITEFRPAIAIADNTPPTCSFERMGDDVMLSGSDAYGIAGYYVSTSTSNPSASLFSSIRIYPVTAGKTYYGHVIDTAGNINTNKCRIVID